MATCIHVYSEIRKKNEWIANERETYNEEKPNRFGWVNATMRRVYCPENYRFYGLLADEVRTSWPWSFPIKGMPADVSEEIRSVCDSFGFEGYGHSYLTLKELVEKYLELMVSGKEARELMAYLRQLIDCLLGLSDNHNNIRIVFWFDN